MPKIIAVFIVCFLISCAKNKPQQPEVDVAKQDISKIEKADLNNLDFIEYLLDETAKEKFQAG